MVPVRGGPGGFRDRLGGALGGVGVVVASAILAVIFIAVVVIIAGVAHLHITSENPSPIWRQRVAWCTASLARAPFSPASSQKCPAREQSSVQVASCQPRRLLREVPCSMRGGSTADSAPPSARMVRPPGSVPSGFAARKVLFRAKADVHFPIGRHRRNTS